MSKAKKILRFFNPYSSIAVILAFCVQMLTYWGAKFFQDDLVHHNFETVFDKNFPVIPGFVIIYMGCYLFWVVNYMIIANINRNHCNRFMIGDWMGKVICFVLFIVIPTTNIRPELTGNSLCEEFLRDVWAADSPYNLFPSAHCFISWMCFIGLRGRKEIPVWYQILSCLIAVSVFVSVLATKQHVILDVLCAILLAEFSFWFSGLVYKQDSKKVAEIC